MTPSIEYENSKSAKKRSFILCWQENILFSFYATYSLILPIFLWYIFFFHSLILPSPSLPHHSNLPSSRILISTIPHLWGITWAMALLSHSLPSSNFWFNSSEVHVCSVSLIQWFAVHWPGYLFSLALLGWPATTTNIYKRRCHQRLYAVGKINNHVGNEKMMLLNFIREISCRV